MKALCGPFLPDLNISTAILAFDGRVGCVVRPLYQGDTDKNAFGVVELRDVRAFRGRARVPGIAPDSADDVPND